MTDKRQQLAKCWPRNDRTNSFQRRFVGKQQDRDSIRSVSGIKNQKLNTSIMLRKSGSIELSVHRTIQ